MIFIYGLEKFLVNKVAEGGPDELKQALKLPKHYLARLPREKWFEIRLKDEEVAQQLEMPTTTINICVKNVMQNLEAKAQQRLRKVMI